MATQLLHRAPSQTSQVVTRGILVQGIFIADYVTRQPAVTQWIAVANVAIKDSCGGASALHWLLVGVGKTEDEAIYDLTRRLAAAQPATDELDKAGGSASSTGDRCDFPCDIYITPWSIHQH